ncbi:MAG: hypothetical protein ACYC61_19085 [Isosphaeraceae bacterium]
MRSVRFIRRLLVVTCCAALCGCGTSGGGKVPDLIPVKGKVTFKGKPVSKGVVRFEPEGVGREASGTIQPDGTFVLTTHKDGDGAVAGHHRVSIVGTGPTPARELIPKQYTQASTSKIELDVDAEHSEFPIDLR